MKFFGEKKKEGEEVGNNNVSSVENRLSEIENKLEIIDLQIEDQRQRRLYLIKKLHNVDLRRI
jgi:chemotaxis receptor (MCP) glutamine deamidase CheD